MKQEGNNNTYGENFNEPANYYDPVKYYFLAGGGLMGESIRKKDWSRTALGEPSEWPGPLKTAVAIMLDNPFGMYIAWGKEYIQLYNDGYRPILGASKHPQALGISSRKTFEEIWHIIGEMFQGVMDGKAVGFPDFHLPLNRNGFVEDCYFDFSYSPIRLEDGVVGGVLVTVIETTEKKKAISALKESEKNFRTMADNIPNLAWMANADGWIFWYNKKWFEFTGTNSGQMEGWGWQSVHHPEELPRVMRNWEYSIKSGVPFEMVFPLKRADGQYRQFLTRVLPVYNEEGKIDQWFGTNTDITEQIEAEQSLKKSEQNLRDTILQAPVAMCVFRGPDFIVEIANDRMFELWGRPSADILQKPIFEGLPEAKDQGFESILEGVYKTGKTFTAESVPINLPRHGRTEKVYVNFVYQAYKETDGGISRILAVALDVTPQVLARMKIEDVVQERTQELETTNTELQRSNSELAQFAYVASHDLQEPLRKISTFALMLEENLGAHLDEDSKIYLNKISESSVRIRNLITGVLSYSELGNKNEAFTQVDLNLVIAAIVADYELLINQKQALIRVENLETIEAISLQMTQLFSNLIGNSLKFCRHEVRPEIEISSRRLTEQDCKHYKLPVNNPGYCIITIRDNGIGFKDKYADRIFQIFQRLHSKSDYEGTGIGLALCKKIAINHQGMITAEGSSNKGAVFNVILPLNQSALTT